MRLLSLLCGLLLLLGQAEAKVRPYEDMVASGVLRVAVYQNFPPYSFMQGGQPHGIDVDLATRLAQGLGLRAEFLWVIPGERLDDDLRNFIWKGHYLRPGVVADVMLRVPYDRDYSNKRNDVGELANDQVVMFGPYQRERWQVVNDARRLPQVDTIAAFREHRIGVELDSVPSFYLTSVLGGQLSAMTVHFPSTQAAFDAMRAGKVDAVMALRGELDWMRAQAGDDQLKNAENTYPSLGQPDWDIGMAVHESNRQLSNALDGELEELVRSGELAKLYAGYGVRYELPGLYQDVQ
ncbi:MULTISPECIES: ABC transporter substrate-binding protein [unclassified Pseudomonas]|uniref:substrate-binding periplasmic protein n=1 Tax=unclassified Pseudomonas TaxID=196821 RepID=UPI0002A3997D|nr:MULTISPECIES: transporter substrate-binding domain-containing protein [unclassified Pseudomonas]MBB1604946.1 amino acid ABC transporter substrate-binding protein [Pseudomonas sp. UMC76]MBB1641895.1 amino acid ABC transporter substrate-binding protein [Pseudomonas sp. UME83]NTX90308.1 amino acid ABC transporter substrate-binding protein [Pseudomonas sp. UMA643]NTY21467.1 amino acid ABC transporter substrate-binding protein [Pseudomonas sp. UMC3103]NTY25579.1 amino acid ABC transporter substr